VGTQGAVGVATEVGGRPMADINNMGARCVSSNGEVTNTSAVWRLAGRLPSRLLQKQQTYTEWWGCKKAASRCIVP
jgi:hypothetical protein